MKCLFFYILVCLTASVNAQEPLTLSGAINLALKNRLDIQIAKNNVEANIINNHIGVAGSLPTINGTINDNAQVTTVNQKLNNGTTINRNWATGNNLTVGIAASQLLYNGMRVVATKHRLEEIQKLSEQQLNGLVQNTIANIMFQYYDVVRQQSYVKTIQRAIAAAKQRLGIIELRQSIGLANNADLFQAQIDLNTVEQSLYQQQLVIDQAKASLLESLNLKTDSIVFINDTIIVDKTIEEFNVQSAVKNNPAILINEQQIQINQWVERETAAQRYPAIRLNGGINFGYNQTAAGQLLYNQSLGPFIGLNISVPIYNGGVFKRQQRVAEINTQNAVLEKENTLISLKATIKRNWLAYRNNLIQADTAQKTYNLSAQLLELTLLRFKLGQATIIEVREAQRSFEAAGFSLINLNFAAKSAEIELKRLSNQLSF